MNKEEVKKCRDKYLESKQKTIEQWKNELWKEIISTINKLSSGGVVIQQIQLYKRKKNIWIMVKPLLSRKQSKDLNAKEEMLDSTKGIPWSIEVIEAFKKELGDFFTIVDEAELEQYNRLTLVIE